MKNYFTEQFSYLKGAPFGYEFIDARESGKFRVYDREDDPAGSADTEEEAKEMVENLNKILPTK